MMSNHDKSVTEDEALSALLDGELDRTDCRRAVDRLLTDAEWQARWRRYATERAALGPGTGPLEAGFADRVQAAVAAEPAIVAGRRSAGAAPRWLRPVAGAAVAASVALTALGGLLSLRDGGGTAAEVVAADASERALPSDTPTGVRTVPANYLFGADQSPEAQAEMRRRLGVYLSNHNQFAAAAGMPGVMPYSRQVTFNAGQ